MLLVLRLTSGNAESGNMSCRPRPSSGLRRLRVRNCLPLIRLLLSVLLLIARVQMEIETLLEVLRLLIQLLLRPNDAVVVIRSRIHTQQI